MLSKKKIEKCEESYTLSEFKQEDENTHHQGGKKDNRQHEDDEDEESTGGQNVRCQHQ
jgi:hypothetical protein